MKNIMAVCSAALFVMAIFKKNLTLTPIKQETLIKLQPVSLNDGK